MPRVKPEDWREMSALEARAARSLSQASFVPGTSAKRFARTVGSQALQAPTKITEKQSALL